MYVVLWFFNEPDGEPGYAGAYLSEVEARRDLGTSVARCAAFVKVPIPRSLVRERWIERGEGQQ